MKPAAVCTAAGFFSACKTRPTESGGVKRRRRSPSSLGRSPYGSVTVSFVQNTPLEALPTTW